MSGMYTSADCGSAFQELALVARLIDPRDDTTDPAVRPVREHVLDHSELTDLVAEAIAESRRVHGTHGRTVWVDAAEAASLILQHVAGLCGADEDWSDSESDSSADDGVSADHV